MPRFRSVTRGTSLGRASAGVQNGELKSTERCARIGSRYIQAHRDLAGSGEALVSEAAKLHLVGADIGVVKMGPKCRMECLTNGGSSWSRGNKRVCRAYTDEEVSELIQSSSVE